MFWCVGTCYRSLLLTLCDIGCFHAICCCRCQVPGPARAVQVVPVLSVRLAHLAPIKTRTTSSAASLVTPGLPAFLVQQTPDSVLRVPP